MPQSVWGSHTSEIILICSFGAQETFLPLNLFFISVVKKLRCLFVETVSLTNLTKEVKNILKCCFNTERSKEQHLLDKEILLF